MRKVTIILAMLLVIAMTTPSSTAKPAVDSNNGPVFGGQHTDVSNQSNQTSQISMLPPIAEDFTATWCSNCVKVEHALDELEAEGELQKYEFHVDPDIDESGFGSPEMTQHLRSRYNVPSPPLVAINGIMKKEGSVPESDSLVSDYRNMMQNQLQLGNAISSFSWTPAANCDCDLPDDIGIINWNLNADLSAYSNATLSVNAWIVEQSADFSGGSNGQGTYFDIVRQMIDLGGNPQGTANITIPAAIDGDDLEIHLVYVLDIPEVEEDDSPVVAPDSNDSALPGFMTSFTILAIMAAAMISRRD